MKVVFIGCVEFSKTMLEEVIDSKTVDVVGVVTKKRSKINSDFYDLSPIAEAKKIDTYFFDANNPNDEMLNFIRGKIPDIIFCFGWSHLISKDIMTSARLGVIGYHPAELPKNRGRHPIIWAIVLGLKKTASTFFLIDEGADSGDIVSQETVEITELDDASTLYAKLSHIAKIQIRNICANLMRETLSTSRQDHGAANSWRKRNDKDGLIDWRMSSEAIHNLVRGLTHPYPGAYFTRDHQKIIVWKTRKIANLDYANIEPGKIISVNEMSFIVKTSDGLIEVQDYEQRFQPVVGEYL